MTVLILCSLFCLEGAAASSAMKPVKAVAIMRDGVKLSVDIYMPKGDGPWPVILMRTSYVKSNPYMATMASDYTRSGFVYVAQDVRGKGESEGKYGARFMAAEDGYDSIEWAARQDWSNGRVGITGLSQPGILATLAAGAAPPSHARAVATGCTARSCTAWRPRRARGEMKKSALKLSRRTAPPFWIHLQR